jgi:6-phosphogluconate dehydrogenase
MEKGHQVVGYSRTETELKSLGAKGLEPAYSIKEFVEKLDSPRIVFLYVPHGKPLDGVCADLKIHLQKGDILVDGGNSHWKGSVRRYKEFQELGVCFLDCGTSGGLEGARNGVCLMVGGDSEVCATVEPIFRDLAVADGYMHVGPAGAGHFSKLIHNAIEFGMLQAIGEGVAMLEASDYKYDLPKLMDNWSHGSVIRSWLIELMGRGLQENKLEDLSDFVEDTREVRWAVEHALEKEVWIPIIAQSELALYRSRDSESVSAKAVAIMRHGFGGHPLHKKS